MGNQSGSSRRATLRAQQEAEARRKRTNRIILVAGIVAGVIIVAIVASVVIWGAMKSSSEQYTPPNAVDGYAVQAFPDKVVDGVPVVLIWEEPQCPGCASLNKIAEPKLEALAQAGKISLRFGVMEFLDGQLKNTSSIKGANGALIADKFGVFTQYLDAMYAAQPAKEGDGYPDELLRTTIPEQIGITGDNLVEFQRLFDAQAANKFIDATNAKFPQLGFGTTPTVTVNGNQIPTQSLMAATTEEELLSVIQAAG